jgi:hypothetical protein
MQSINTTNKTERMFYVTFLKKSVNLIISLVNFFYESQ